ncbi:WWE domain [Trinorchestia longiramus]|nr:WWE domain [Trinorchestia longiramus]
MASDEELVLEEGRERRCPRHVDESSSLFGDAVSQDFSIPSARDSSNSTPGPPLVGEELETWSAGPGQSGRPHSDAPQSSPDAPAMKPLAVRGLLCGAAADSDDSMDEETRCAVCFMQMVHPVRLPCGHVFCFLCVKGVAITSSPRCALCRHPIPPDFLLRPTLVMMTTPHRRSAASSTRNQASISSSTRNQASISSTTRGQAAAFSHCTSENEPAISSRAVDALASAGKRDFASCELKSSCYLQSTNALASASSQSQSESGPPAACKVADESLEESKNCLPGISINYQWFYEGRNGWWQYDERTNKEIETAYQAEESTCQVMVVGLVFVVDFARMLQYRIKDPAKRRKIKRDVSSAPTKGIAGISLKRLDGVEDDGPDTLGEGEGVEDGTQTHVVGGDMPLSVRHGGVTSVPLNSDSASLRYRIPPDERLDPSVRSRLTTLTDVPSWQGDFVPSVVLPPQSSSQTPGTSSWRHDDPTHDLVEEFRLPDDLSDDASIGSDPAVEIIRHTLDRFQLMRYPELPQELPIHQCCRSVCTRHRSVLMPHVCYCKQVGSIGQLLQTDTPDVAPSRSGECLQACECTQSSNCPAFCECSQPLVCPHACDSSVGSTSSTSLRSGHHCRCCQHSREFSACCQHCVHCRLPDNSVPPPGLGNHVPPPGLGNPVPPPGLGNPVPPPGLGNPVTPAGLGNPVPPGPSNRVPPGPSNLMPPSLGRTSVRCITTGQLAGNYHKIPPHLDSQSSGGPPHLESYTCLQHLDQPPRPDDDADVGISLEDRAAVDASTVDGDPSSVSQSGPYAPLGALRKCKGAVGGYALNGGAYITV